MYAGHFGFSQGPFESSLDPQFLYPSEAHEEVLAALLYFARERKSFALVVGDVGTGKTLLINCLLTMLPANARPVVINHPDLGYLEIIYYLCARLGIDRKNMTTSELLGAIKTVLTRELAAGQHTLLIIDEAHLLSDRGLEHIRLLSNIETRSDKLLQILLVGQHELTRRLSREQLRQLRQRININRFLSPLGAEETIHYIDHRLGVAGSSFPACFEESCRQPLVELTGGVPRLINHLCDNALLICSLEKAARVSPEHLRKASNALRTDLLCLPDTDGPGRAWWSAERKRWLLRLGPTLLLAVILLLLALKRGAGWPW